MRAAPNYLVRNRNILHQIDAIHLLHKFDIRYLGDISSLELHT